MTSLVLSHLVNSVMDSIETSNLGILRNAELILASASLGSGTLLQVSLRIPYALTQQFSETRSMISLFESIALKCLCNLGIAFSVCLTSHSKIHTNLTTLTIEMIT